MKNKIVSLSKNDDFKSVLNGKRISNKYLTIFFKRLSYKDKNKLNISFVTKKKIVEYGLEIFVPFNKFLKSSLFERLEILFFIKLIVFFYPFFFYFLEPSAFSLWTF